MADVKISALGAISVVAGEDLVAIVDDPSGTPASRKATITQIATFINASAITASSTTTFTNKTIDADGTGNSITNIENANIKASAGIDATKLADGTVTSTELQYINTLSSNAQTQITAKSPIASPTFTGTVVLPNVPAIVTTALNLKAPLASPALTGTATGVNLTLSGDLTVNGTTSTINSTTLTVDDKNIEMGSVATPSDTTADGGGITLKGATDKTLIWDNANDNWTSNQDWNIATGKVFKINNVSTLTATSLGSAVVGSSLTSVGTIATGVWNGTAIASTYIAGDAIDGTKLADNAVNSEHYTDGSIDLAHMSVNSIDSDQYVDGSIDLAHLSVNSVDSDQYVDGSIDLAHISTGAKTECMAMAVSDNTSDLATGTVFTFYMPYAMTLTDIKASVLTAPTGAGLIVDVHDAGTTIMGTNKLDIDVSEFHTSTAGTQPALTDTALANNAKIEVIIDQIGSTVAGAGLVVYLIGYQT